MEAPATCEQVAGDERAPLCTLVSSDDLELVYRLKHALEARGLEAFIVGDPMVGARPQGPTMPGVAVRRRDLVYARWVAFAVGVDTWPE